MINKLLAAYYIMAMAVGSYALVVVLLLAVPA